MKKKILVITLLAAAITGTFFALRALLPNLKDAGVLSSPENVRVDGHSLVWYSVENADGYEVEIDGEIRSVSRAKINLKYADNGKTVRVRAVGRGYAPSEFTEAFSLAFSEATLRGNIVTYGLSQLDISRKEFIYTGEPVSVEPEDFSAYDYEFLYWYIYDNGIKYPQDKPFVSWESVLLLAEVRPIEYPVTFVLPEGFPFAGGLPETYNVETLSDLLSLTSRAGGYRIVGWSTTENGENEVSAASLTLGPLTLYPRISLINAGFTFSPCEGGLALESYCGGDECLYVPAFYNGEKVVKVSGGAIRGENAPNVEYVEFYGDIFLDEGAVSACPKLTRVVFNGNAAASESAIYVAGDLSGNDALTIVIYGAPPSETAFIAGYFGFPPEKPVVLYVSEEYFEAVGNAYSFCEVKRLPEEE
ncbi:MAG: hypothetical protein J6Z34_04970 [Clostridia bacterium]|nr:hypothetical protein [Clostridia bacterium]